MKTLLVLAISLFSMPSVAQDTLMYEGSAIMENINNEWVGTAVEFTPVFKMSKQSDNSAYLFLQIGNNWPIVDGIVTVLTDMMIDSVRTVGFISDVSGPCILRIYGDGSATFHFEPDFETETMKSYIVMNQSN